MTISAQNWIIAGLKWSWLVMRYERPFCHGLWPSNFRLGLAPNERMNLITSGRMKRSESGVGTRAMSRRER